MSLGFEILYPKSCQEVSEDLSLADLRKRLTDLADALQKESLEQSNLDESALELPIDNHPFKHYRGLLMHLNSSQFSEHFDTSVRIRACVCALQIVKLLCPSNPFESLVEEALVKKGFLDWILDSVNHLSTIKSTSEPLFAKSLLILRNAAQMGIFVWITESEEAPKLMSKLVKTFYNVLKTVDIWTWSDRSSIINLLMGCIGLVIKRGEHFLTDDTLIFIIKHLIEPYKSAHPVLCEASRDFLLSYSCLVQEHIQLLLQKSLLSSQFFEAEPSKPEAAATLASDQDNLDLEKDKFDVDMDADDENPQTPPVSDDAQLDADDDKEGGESLENQIGERLYLLIHALHCVQHNLDIDVEMRRICIHSFALIAESNPKLAMGELLEVFLKRVFDLVDEIRVLALRISKKLLNGIFQEGDIHERIFQLLLGRVRDKSFQVRREVLGVLGALYKQYLKLWVKVPAAELGDELTRKMETCMQRIMNTILFLYYLPSVDDRIIIERFLKGCVFPHSMSSVERSRALLLAYRIAENSSIKVVEEIFNVHHDSFSIMKSTISMLSSADPTKLHTPCAISRAIGHKLDACASLLPQSPKYGDLIKRYFMGSQLLPTVKQHLLKLFTKPLTCSEAATIVLKLYNSEVPGSLSHKESIKHAVKLLLERTAPVLFDPALCAEILNQMVIEREIGSDYLAMERYTRLLHSLSACYGDVLPAEDVIDFLQSLLEQTTSETEQLSPQLRLSLQTIEASVLNVFCVIMGYKKTSALGAGPRCKLNGQENIDTSVNGKEREFTCPFNINGNVQLSPKLMNLFPFFKQFTMTAIPPKEQVADSWSLERKRSKYSIRALSLIIYAIDSQLHAASDEVKIPEPAVDLLKKDINLKSLQKEIAQLEKKYDSSKQEFLHIFKDRCERLLDAIFDHCLSIDKTKADSVAKLAALSQIALRFPSRYASRISKLFLRLVSEGIFSQCPDKRGAAGKRKTHGEAAYLADQDLALVTKLKLGVLKLMTNWLCGLNTDNDDFISPVVELIFKLVQCNGDLVEDSKLERAELARIRAAAGCSWLKLARFNTYSKSVSTACFYRIGDLIK
ncbi:Sister chromatid cohesion protein PDS5 B, partial [Cichlidogyrus casuarinus]